MNQDEQLALDAMKIARNEIKMETYDLMALMADSNTDLVIYGYRNGLGDALERILKKSLGEINKQVAAYIRKYPD